MASGDYPPPKAKPSLLVHLRLRPTGDEARPVAVMLQPVLDELNPLQLDIQDDDCVVATLHPASVGMLQTVQEGLAPASSVTEAAAEPQEPTLEQQHAELVKENLKLQSLVRQYLEGTAQSTTQQQQQNSTGQVMEGAEQRYLLDLQQLRRLRSELDEASTAAAVALAPERARLAAAAAKAQAQRDALLQFVGDVGAASARAAAAGRVKTPVSAAAVQHFLAAEPELGATVRTLRASHARLTRRLEAAEQRLKAADQLSAEGLHLVDYEQLRIENASLASRREARAAEVDKLRVKLAQAVQIAAHVREKLHCVEEERCVLAARLQAVECEVQEARTLATAARARRERAQRRRGELAQDWRIVTDRRCLADMRQQEEELELLKAKSAELRARYESLGRQAGSGVTMVE